MRAIAAAAILLAFLPAASPARAAADPPEDELLVLEVRLGERPLISSMTAWSHPGGLLLPLGSLVEALEMPIAIDAASGAQGAVRAEGPRLTLDLGTRTWTAGERSGRFEPQLARSAEGELLVDSRLLSAWLPIDFTLDSAALVLRIAPREALPVQERWAREERRRRMGEPAPGAPGSADERFALEPHPYQMLSWPVLDAGVSVSLGRGEGGSLAVRPSLLAQGDLLAMTAGLSVAGGAPRLALERRDPRGGLLGPLGATEVRVGDVSVAFDPLLSHGRSGSGFEIVRGTGGGGPERRALAGDDLPGWEVELYRGGALLAARTVDENGRYEFPGVRLQDGLNVLRLVFYGPQGQKHEKEERIFVPVGLIPAGETAYRLGIAGQTAGSFAIEHGVSRALALGASLASLTLDDGRHEEVGLSAGTSVLGITSRFHLLHDLSDGWAGRLEAAGRIGPLHFHLEHAELRGLRTQEIADRDLRSRSRMQLDGQIRLPGLPSVPPLPLTVTATRELRAGRERLTLEAASGLALTLGPLLLGNRWDLAYTEGALTGRGDLALNARIGRLGLRGNLGYQLAPAPALSALAVTGEVDLRQDLALQFNATQELSTQAIGISGGLAWRRQQLRLGLTAGLSGDGRLQAGASIACSLGREPRTGRLRMQGEAGASQGAVSARVFLDQDGDGRFSPGDSPLPGIRFQLDGRPLAVATGEDGTAWLRLPPYGHAGLSLAEASLTDPSWIAVRQGVGLVPRPGAAWTADFPVVATGEIDGTVLLRRPGGRREASNVRLQLLDASGAVAQEVTSQYDGFYLFEKVRPGRYTLRVAPDQLDRLRLTATPESLAIDLHSGEVRSGLEIVLVSPPESADRAASSGA